MVATKNIEVKVKMVGGWAGNWACHGCLSSNIQHCAMILKIVHYGRTLFGWHNMFCQAGYNAGTEYLWGEVLDASVKYYNLVSRLGAFGVGGGDKWHVCRKGRGWWESWVRREPERVSTPLLPPHQPSPSSCAKLDISTSYANAFPNCSHRRQYSNILK